MTKYFFSEQIRGFFFLFFHFALHCVEFTLFLYHLKIISWNQLFRKLFTKEIVFTEIFQKVVIQKFCKIHSVRSRKIAEILSHFLVKNFVKSTFLLKSLIKSWFHEKMIFSETHSVEIRNFTLNHGFFAKISSNCFDGKKFAWNGAVNFSFFLTAWEIISCFLVLIVLEWSESTNPYSPQCANDMY